ncbi:hypothetical protein B296_00038287 [Ensete ventricosum]|uniref:Uncharacterized protein n=1 Tax=Ensete ventricosum TaxID=4639 RepID=A0A426WYV0_ENSVE|nr:hypothetical protein B296_00038287 [Ensete ventricosum]
MVSRKNAMVINFREVVSRVEFRSVFRAPSRIFKILANPNVLAHDHGKSYEHDFAKKSTVIYLPVVVRRVEFRSVFRALSRIYKIMANPNVLAHESCFDRFYVHRLRNSKY